MPAAKPSFPILRHGWPLTQGLVGGWSACEGSGPTLGDVSGNDNNGTLQAGGTSWSQGQSGWCLNMNGTTFVSVPDNPSLNLSAAGTLAGWFYSTAVWSGQNPYLFGKSTSTVDSHSQYRFEFFSGSLFFTLADGNNTSSQNSVAWAPSTNTWYHIAVTWNGTTTFYVNGAALAAGAAQTTFTWIGTSTGLQIGNDTVRNGNSARGFKGLSDGFAGYNRALSGDEISSLSADSWQMYRRRSWRLKSGAAPQPYPWWLQAQMGAILAQ